MKKHLDVLQREQRSLELTKHIEEERLEREQCYAARVKAKEHLVNI